MGLGFRVKGFKFRVCKGLGLRVSIRCVVHTVVLLAKTGTRPPTSTVVLRPKFRLTLFSLGSEAVNDDPKSRNNLPPRRTPPDWPILANVNIPPDK